MWPAQTWWAVDGRITESWRHPRSGRKCGEQREMSPMYLTWRLVSVRTFVSTHAPGCGVSPLSHIVLPMSEAYLADLLACLSTNVIEFLDYSMFTAKRSNHVSRHTIRTGGAAGVLGSTASRHPKVHHHTVATRGRHLSTWHEKPIFRALAPTQRQKHSIQSQE